MALSDYKTALVTGASSGIGAAIVEQLTERGIKVHAVARRKDRLDELAARTGCVTHALDLHDTAGIKSLGESLPVDILVNNAGHGRGFTNLFEADVADVDDSIDINVRAVYHLLRAILPGMVERDHGYVVNIGSMTGLYSVPSSVYGGSKAAVHMLSRNLRLELAGKKIRVTEICPGRVATEFYDRAIDDPVLRDTLKNTGTNELTPADVASTVTHCLDTPAHVNINMVEMQPLEQTYGGSTFTPFENG